MSVVAEHGVLRRVTMNELTMWVVYLLSAVITFRLFFNETIRQARELKKSVALDELFIMSFLSLIPIVNTIFLIIIALGILLRKMSDIEVIKVKDND